MLILQILNVVYVVFSWIAEFVTSVYFYKCYLLTLSNSSLCVHKLMCILQPSCSTRQNCRSSSRYDLAYIIDVYQNMILSQQNNVCIHTQSYIHVDVLRIPSLLTPAVGWNHGVDSCTSVRPGMAELNVRYGQYWSCSAEYIVTDLGPFILVRHGIR